MAAKTASVSYARESGPQVLEQTLVSGNVPPEYTAHLAHLLDETPVPIVVMAVEEAAEHAQMPPKLVWRNVANMAKSLAVHRQGLWA